MLVNAEAKDRLRKPRNKRKPELNTRFLRFERRRAATADRAIVDAALGFGGHLNAKGLRRRTPDIRRELKMATPAKRCAASRGR